MLKPSSIFAIELGGYCIAAVCLVALIASICLFTSIVSDLSRQTVYAVEAASRIQTVAIELDAVNRALNNENHLLKVENEGLKK